MTKPRRRSLAPVRIDQLEKVTGGGWLGDIVDSAIAAATSPTTTIQAPRRDALTIYY